MQKTSCFVIGAGGHGKVVVRLLLTLGYEVLAIFDHAEGLWGQQLLGVPVKGPPESIPDGHPAIIAIGDNRERKRLSESLALDWQTLIHPRAFVDAGVEIGTGSVVLPKAVVHVDATLGQHVIVNSSATVEHDCQIDDFAHIAPGSTLAGSVRIGQGALVGIGASTTVGVNIGAWTTVGAGASVVRDLPPGRIASGVPARLHSQ